MHRHVLAAAAFLAVGSLASPVCSASPPPRFLFTDLGTLPGGQHSIATAINDAGVIVGSSTGPQSSLYHHATAWIDGAVVQLGGLAMSGAVAHDVNAEGRVVGITDEFAVGLHYPFHWFDGEIEQMQTPFLSTFSAPLAINEAGVIVGLAHFGPGTSHQQPAIWIDGEIQALESLGLGHNAAMDINEHGVIVGWSSGGGPLRLPVVWEDGELAELPTLGGTRSAASAISNNGLIVGYSWKPAPPGDRPVTWFNGRISELPALSSQDASAWSVNDAGWIVGTSAQTTNVKHAVLWIDGDIHDLASLVVNALGSFQLSVATDVNASGRIVGYGLVGSSQRAFLLTPVEPADINADGAVDGADLGLMLASWGGCPRQAECPADLNGDGIVDGADLGLLLASWSQ